jgi:hypothetical protein
VSCYVAQAGLELKNFLLQPPECWKCGHKLPYLALSHFLHIFP